MTVKQALDRATREWLSARLGSLGEFSGDIRHDSLAALDEINAVRTPHLPPITVIEAEQYPGQLTEPE